MSVMKSKNSMESKPDRIIAIIPARSGSKGLPGKNIRMIAGKPLIAWTIESALEAKIFYRVIVSTDSPAIADVAQKWGAEVPFLRPEELAGDNSSSYDVINYTLKQIEDIGLKDWVMMLQPTSPLRSSKDIKDMVLERTDTDFLSFVSVCPFSHPVEWINTIPENGSMKDFLSPGVDKNPRQNYKKNYILNGALYLSRVDYYLENRGFFGNKTKAFVMSEEKSIDIDTLFDFRLAECVLAGYNRGLVSDQ